MSALFGICQLYSIGKCKIAVGTKEVDTAVMKNLHPIVARLKEIMSNRGISRADLARMTGIPYHRLNPWFSRDNAKPSGPDLFEVAKSLGVSVSYLADGIVDQPNDKAKIMSLFDSLPAEKQQQLADFAHYLATQGQRHDTG